MDIFRKIFGLHHNDDQYNRNRFCDIDDRNHPEMNQDNSENFFNDDPFSRRSFDVFSDPIQMHQYFEQQMNEFLKMFGFHGNSEFSIGFPNIPKDGWSQTPPDINENPTHNIRDQFLKPGYAKPESSYSERVDRDLDEKVRSGDLNSLLGEKHDSQVTPYVAPKSKNFFYGTSQSMKTISNPDGSVETHRTTRDNEGNEESCVCQRIGNKEYCIIKRKDKYGKEEVTENFVNMTEKEKDIFTKPKDNRRISDGTSDFPWKKFF